jgi:hypothetical protein
MEVPNRNSEAESSVKRAKFGQTWQQAKKTERGTHQPDPEIVCVGEERKVTKIHAIPENQRHDQRRNAPAFSEE